MAEELRYGECRISFCTQIPATTEYQVLVSRRIFITDKQARNYLSKISGFYNKPDMRTAKIGSIVCERTIDGIPFSVLVAPDNDVEEKNNDVENLKTSLQSIFQKRFTSLFVFSLCKPTEKNRNVNSRYFQLLLSLLTGRRECYIFTEIGDTLTMAIVQSLIRKKPRDQLQYHPAETDSPESRQMVVIRRNEESKQEATEKIKHASIDVVPLSPQSGGSHEKKTTPAITIKGVTSRSNSKGPDTAVTKLIVDQKNRQASVDRPLPKDGLVPKEKTGARPAANTRMKATASFSSLQRPQTPPSSGTTQPAKQVKQSPGSKFQAPGSIKPAIPKRGPQPGIQEGRIQKDSPQSDISDSNRGDDSERESYHPERILDTQKQQLGMQIDQSEEKDSPRFSEGKSARNPNGVPFPTSLYGGFGKEDGRFPASPRALAQLTSEREKSLPVVSTLLPQRNVQTIPIESQASDRLSKVAEEDYTTDVQSKPTAISSGKTSLGKKFDRFEKYTEKGQQRPVTSAGAIDSFTYKTETHPSSKAKVEAWVEEPASGSVSLPPASAYQTPLSQAKTGKLDSRQHEDDLPRTLAEYPAYLERQSQWTSATRTSDNAKGKTRTIEETKKTAVLREVSTQKGSEGRFFPPELPSDPSRERSQKAKTSPLKGVNTTIEVAAGSDKLRPSKHLQGADYSRTFEFSLEEEKLRTQTQAIQVKEPPLEKKDFEPDQFRQVERLSHSIKKTPLSSQPQQPDNSDSSPSSSMDESDLMSKPSDSDMVDRSLQCPEKSGYRGDPSTAVPLKDSEKTIKEDFRALHKPEEKKKPGSSEIPDKHSLNLSSARQSGKASCGVDVQDIEAAGMKKASDAAGKLRIAASVPSFVAEEEVGTGELPDIYLESHQTEVTLVNVQPAKFEGESDRFKSPPKENTRSVSPQELVEDEPEPNQPHQVPVATELNKSEDDHGKLSSLRVTVVDGEFQDFSSFGNEEQKQEIGNLRDEASSESLEGRKSDRESHDADRPELPEPEKQPLQSHNLREFNVPTSSISEKTNPERFMQDEERDPTPVFQPGSEEIRSPPMSLDIEDQYNPQLEHPDETEPRLSPVHEEEKHFIEQSSFNEELQRRIETQVIWSELEAAGYAESRSDLAQLQSAPEVYPGSRPKGKFDPKNVAAQYDFLEQQEVQIPGSDLAHGKSSPAPESIALEALESGPELQHQQHSLIEPVLGTGPQPIELQAPFFPDGNPQIIPSVDGIRPVPILPHPELVEEVKERPRSGSFQEWEQGIWERSQLYPQPLSEELGSHHEIFGSELASLQPQSHEYVPIGPSLQELPRHLVPVPEPVNQVPSIFPILQQASRPFIQRQDWNVQPPVPYIQPNSQLQISEPRPEPEFQEENKTFIKIAREDLQCLVCMELPEHSRSTACCGAVICDTCAGRIDRNRCPQCRQGMNLIENKFLSKLLSSVEVKCDCGEVVKRKDKEAHKATCSQRTYACPCTKFRGNKGGLQKHLKREHSVEIMTMMVRKFPSSDLK